MLKVSEIELFTDLERYLQNHEFDEKYFKQEKLPNSGRIV